MYRDTETIFLALPLSSNSRGIFVSGAFYDGIKFAA